MQRKLLDARRVPFAQRLERARVAVFCSLDQDRVAQLLVDQRPLGAKGLPRLTRAAPWGFHLRNSSAAFGDVAASLGREHQAMEGRRERPYWTVRARLRTHQRA